MSLKDVSISHESNMLKTEQWKNSSNFNNAAKNTIQSNVINKNGMLKYDCLKYNNFLEKKICN